MSEDNVDPVDELQLLEVEVEKEPEPVLPPAVDGRSRPRKICLCCGKPGSRKAETCRDCGEASWSR